MSLITRYAPTKLAAPIASSSRAFATTLPASAAAKSKSAKPALKKKQGGSFNKGKSATQGATKTDTGRITLRSSLAVDVADLSDLVELHPETFNSKHVGKPTVFPRKTFTQLKSFGLSRKLEQELSSGGNPACASVVRQSTVDLAKTLERAKSASSKDARYLLNGEKGSGKSMLLLQSVAYALESNWIVLYIPSAAEWTSSSSPYAYDADSQTFHQPALSSLLLSKILAVNAEALSRIPISDKIDFANGRSISKGAKLLEVVELGRDESISVAVLEVVISSLASQTQYPVLVAIDGVDALFRKSAYRSTDYSLLEPYHLSVPRLMLEYLSAEKSFSRGALVTAVSLTTPLPAELLSGLSLPTPHPLTPYTKLEPQHLQNASSGLQKVDVPFGMSPEEAAGLFEIWSKKGWARKSTDEVFLEAFAGAAGNPRELSKGLERNMQALTFSPFFEDRLAVASGANFGLVGNGRLHILQYGAGGLRVAKHFDTQDCVYDVAWNESHEWSTNPPSPRERIRHTEHSEFVMGVSWALFEDGLVASCAWDEEVHLFKG
ncbi:small subunit ribosomal protein S29, partial [Tremellales sp. Uapishka_1]